MADKPSLLLGSMELYDPDGSAFGCEVLVEGTSRGQAVPIRETIESFLEQGALEFTTGWESRDVPIRVTMSSLDLVDGLANAEAALLAELGKSNELIWTPYHPELPGDHLGTPICFEVVNSWLEPVEGDRWDLDETDPRPTATYQIRLVCRSFVHSINSTVVEAVSTTVAPTLTTILDGSSSAGWSATIGGVAATISNPSGTVQAVRGVLRGSTQYELLADLPASVMPIATAGANKYIVVDFYLPSPTRMWGIKLYLNAIVVDLDPVVVYATATPGQYRAVFYVDLVTNINDATIQGTISRISLPGDLNNVTKNIGIQIDAIYRTTAIPNPGSGEREQLRTFSVNGTFPAIGALSVQHASSALGNVLLYTCADKANGYNPAGRGYRSGGGSVSADANAMSGFSEPMDGNATFDYPAVSLEQGEYLLMVSARRTGNPTGVRQVYWSITPRLNGTDLDVTDLYVTPLTLDTTYGLHRLGIVTLPSMTLPPASSAYMRIGIDDSSANSLLDNVYLFNMTTGQLTQVACGTGSGAVGGTSRRLWIDPPTVENEGRGEAVRGHSADRSDAFSAYPAAVEVGRHQFDPEWPVKVFSVTSNPTTAAAVAFEYRAAGLTRLKSDW